MPIRPATTITRRLIVAGGAKPTTSCPASSKALSTSLSCLKQQRYPTSINNTTTTTSSSTSCLLLYRGASRAFSATPARLAQNRLYTPVRHPDELQSYLLLCASSRRPLLTLWTASSSYAANRDVAELMTALLAPSGAASSSPSTPAFSFSALFSASPSASPSSSSSSSSSVGGAVGEAEGGVAFCEVEYDAPDVAAAGLGAEYMITALPTLLAFDARGEAVRASRVTNVGVMRDEGWLREWIRREAGRG